MNSYTVTVFTTNISSSPISVFDKNTPQSDSAALLAANAATEQAIQQLVVANQQKMIYIYELMRYDKLYQIIMLTFKSYIDYFNKKDYSTLENLFTNTEALRIGQLLVGDTFDIANFTDAEINAFIQSGTIFSAYQTTDYVFQEYKSFIYLLIDTLNVDIGLSNLNTNLLETNAILEKDSNILKNIELLQIYIDEHYNNFNANSTLISVDHTVSESLGVKREYFEYIKMYGIPEDGLFESEKLNQIIYDIDHGLL